MLVKPSVPDVNRFLAGLKPNDHTSEFIDGQIYRKHIPQNSEIYLQAQLWDAINAATPHSQQAIAKPSHGLIAYPNHRCSFGGWSIVLDLAIFLNLTTPAPPSPSAVADPEIASSNHNVSAPDVTHTLHFHSSLTPIYTRYPDWMIEILPPEQDAIHAIRTGLHCLAHGTQMVWLIDLNNRLTFVFVPHQTPIEVKGRVPLPTPESLNLALTVDQILSWIPNTLNPSFNGNS